MKKDMIFEEAYAEVINQSQPSRLDYLREVFSKREPSREGIIQLLNIALMDQWLAEFNYFASYNLSKTDGKTDFDPEFQQHETEEKDHRTKIVNRLRQLKSPVPVVLFQEFMDKNSAGSNWKQQLSENSGQILLHRLQEEQDAVKFYSIVLAYIEQDRTDSKDTTTYQIIKDIKADEQAHAKDLRDLAIEHKLIVA